MEEFKTEKGYTFYVLDYESSATQGRTIDIKVSKENGSRLGIIHFSLYPDQKLEIVDFLINYNASNRGLGSLLYKVSIEYLKTKRYDVSKVYGSMHYHDEEHYQYLTNFYNKLGFDTNRKRLIKSIINLSEEIKYQNLVEKNSSLKVENEELINEYCRVIIKLFNFNT